MVRETTSQECAHDAADDEKDDDVTLFIGIGIVLDSSGQPLRLPIVEQRKTYEVASELR